MAWWVICLIILGTLIIFAAIHFAGKNKRPFRRAVISMLSGVLTLLAVNITGIFTGVVLPVSLMSVLVSAVGGIPGVTLMLGLNLFF